MSGFSEEITLEGHLIDSWILPKVFDAVMDLGGSFDLQEIHVGRRKDEISFARLKVVGNRRVAPGQHPYRAAAVWRGPGFSQGRGDPAGALRRRSTGRVLFNDPHANPGTPERKVGGR